MNERKMNVIARFEQELEKKYGKEFTRPIKVKEIKDFDKQLKKFNEKKKREPTERNANYCNICKSISFRVDDDIYFIKYDCCERCYINNIER